MAQIQSTLALAHYRLSRLLDSPQLYHIKNVAFLFVLYQACSQLYTKFVIHGPRRTFTEFYTHYFKLTFKYVRLLPSVRAKIDSELDNAIKGLEEGIKDDPKQRKFLQLPQHGFTDEEVLSQLEEYKNIGGINWENGRVSGAVYHGGKDLSNLLSQAYKMFSVTNPLHPEVFPGIRKMESEIVAMVLNLYNAPPTGAGVTTSGGTESILMAVKAYRELARDKKGITEPEMVIPVTAHAAFMKAGEYFGIKVIEIPCDPITCKVNTKLVKRAINKNTIMLVGSGVQFPHGIFDDIPTLASLAKKYDIGMHVDCCLGSFIVPFLEKAGLPTEPFDFRVNGVTSISCDTHKYGFAPKGSSIIMYRSKELRKYQYFVMVNWTGGIYASPSMAGSRPGALIAGCWAAMVRMGYDGYLESAKKIVGTRQKIQDGIKKIPNLFVYGDPKSSVIAFGANPPVNIYDVNDKMSKLGWSLNALQNPPAVHMACTMLTTSSVDDFLNNLEEVTRDLREHPENALGSTAKIYGSNTGASALVVEEVASAYIDLLYKA